MTAARDLDSERAVRHNGFFHYSAKPFTMRDLHGRLDEVVQGLRTVRALNGTDEPMKQHELDTVMSAGRVAAASADLPKGLSAATPTLIESTLSTAGADQSAPDVANASGMSRLGSPISRVPRVDQQSRINSALWASRVP
ncbi:hypothetical protein K0651_09225 [Ornithinimicrobium sp. Arc0846-15]|nr:hypothetical protein [Ornithinimicrobium laminariae]